MPEKAPSILERFDAETEAKETLIRLIREHAMDPEPSEWFKDNLNCLEDDGQNLSSRLGRAKRLGNRFYPGRLPIDEGHIGRGVWRYEDKPLKPRKLDKLVDDYNHSNLDFEARFGTPSFSRNVRRLFNLALARIFDVERLGDLKNVQEKLLPALEQAFADHFTIQREAIVVTVDSTRQTIASMGGEVDESSFTVLASFYQHFDLLKASLEELKLDLADAITLHEEMTADQYIYSRLIDLDGVHSDRDDEREPDPAFLDLHMNNPQTIQAAEMQAAKSRDAFVQRSSKLMQTFKHLYDAIVLAPNPANG